MRRFKNILYIVASDSDNRVAFEHATTLASNNQACLTILQVIDETPATIKMNGRDFSTKEFHEKLVMEHQKKLQALVDSLEQKIEVQIKILVGISFLEIIREVLRNNHDLVIKTAESSGGLLERVFGGNDMHLLRKCPCPVWLVNPKAQQKYQRILAAIDVYDEFQPNESETNYLLNLQIVEMASSLALSEFAELHIVNAWETMGESVIRRSSLGWQEKDVITYIEEVRQQHQQIMNTLMNEVMIKLGQNALDYLKPQLHLQKGSPRREIPALAIKIKADLVVMGTVARTGISGFFMGNTAETILNQLDCSVLAVKPLGFETPISLGDLEHKKY